MGALPDDRVRWPHRRLPLAISSKWIGYKAPQWRHAPVGAESALAPAMVVNVCLTGHAWVPCPELAVPRAFGSVSDGLCESARGILEDIAPG